MSKGIVEDWIRETARDLSAVHPIPPLRAAAAAVIALGLVAVAAEWLLGGPGLRECGAGVWTDPTYLAALVGLAFVAGGATTAALAAAVPGRDGASRLGTGVAVLGLVVAVGGGLVGLVRSPGLHASGELFECLSCIRRSAILGLAPTLVACGFIAYAAMRRPGTLSALALAGGVALGAAAVHASCPNDDAIHRLVAHTLAPILAAVVLAAPLAALLRRWARRSTLWASGGTPQSGGP
jgi:hypothetical protein